MKQLRALENERRTLEKETLYREEILKTKRTEMECFERKHM
jgi:hypothetical protein